MKAIIFLFVVFSVNFIDTNAQDPYVPKVKVFKIPLHDNLNNIDYKIDRIHYQDWTIESIRSFKYSDNTNIKLISKNDLWDSITFAAYCVIDNKYLYNGYAIETNKLCPYRWSIASRDDYYGLAQFMSRDSTIYKKYFYIIDTLSYSKTAFRQVYCIKK